MSQFLADKNWRKKASMNKVPRGQRTLSTYYGKNSSEGYSSYLIFLKGLKPS